MAKLRAQSSAFGSNLALVQIRQALRPDGLLLAALIGGDSLGVLRACLAEAEAQAAIARAVSLGGPRHADYVALQERIAHQRR